MEDMERPDRAQTWRENMRWLNPASSLFLIGFSVLIFAASLKLGTGDHQNPGPGFMALLASALLFFLSLAVFIKNLRISRRKDQGDQEEENASRITWERLKKPIILGTALVVYSLILEGVGFVIATFLLMFVMIVTYEPKKWYRDLLIAVLLASMSFFIFDRWLQVQLPAGLFRM